MVIGNFIMDAKKSPMRCCVCPPVDLEENEIEIVNSGSTERLSLEEEALPEEEQLDLKKIQRELLCIKSVIEKYQGKLKAFLEPCPDVPCVDFETELLCSENKEICSLQRNHFKLQSQINELTNCCKTAKSEFKILRSLICEKTKQIFQLQKEIAALESWRRKLELEAGLCIERFEYLKHVKAEWSDIVEALEKEKLCYLQKERRLVPKACYIKDKKYFVDQIQKLKQMFMEVYEFRNENPNYCCGPDTPPREDQLKLAEIEYIELKNKFNEKKYKDMEDEVAFNEDKEIC